MSRPMRVGPGVALFLLACAAPEGQPGGSVARLSIGPGDSLVIHGRLPKQLPVRAFDRDGREVALPPLKLALVGGDSIPVSSIGVVTCHAPGRAELSVSAGAVVSRQVVLCRPVQAVRLEGPLDVLLSDSSQRLRPEILGVDGQPMDGGIVGRAEVLDRSVAVVEGDRVIPRAPGGTLLTLTVGDESATIAVHVYREVATLDGLGPGQDHLAVPLRLGRGDRRRWPLPAGTWMIAMQPNEPLPRDLQFAVEDAGCESGGFPKGRIVCLSRGAAHLVITLPPGSPSAGLNARLLLRRTSPQAAGARPTATRGLPQRSIDGRVA